MSEIIELPFSEEQSKEIAGKVLVDISKKIRDDIAEKFYEEMSGYLYEHYENNREKIQDELIELLIGAYVKEPDSYKFKKLRDKLFEEHKEEILKDLTDQAISETITTIIEKYTTRDYHFEWRWFHGIADFICDHPNLFLDNKRFGDRIALRIKNRDDQIKFLKERLGDADD